jgi:formamidopyrimidine-DNA glycosylase
MVIFKKTGQIDSAEWEKILTNNKSGERPSKYCPNCQRNKF